MAATVSPHQPAALRFADCFWDSEDRGVEVVLDKLRNSKQTCEEIKKLYEIRSQIEEDYGERLLKLSQLIVGQAEEGTLSESLSHIPSALETTGRAHLDLAQQLKYHLEAPLDGFLKEQRDMRRLHHQQIENARQLKNMHHTNAIKAKEFYTAECTKVAGMEKYLRERGFEMAADEVHQVKEEIEEGKKMVNAAEQEYRRAIEVLGSVTNDWVDSWKTTCDTFQEMEEKRIQYVNGSLRSFSSMMSSVYLVDDQCCERIRTTLELTNVQSDIEEFITRYGTGKEIPAPLHFEPYSSMDIQSGQITPASSVHQDMQSVAAATSGTPPAVPDTKAKALPPMPESASEEHLRSVDQQLQDLSVKRNSREMVPQTDNSKPVDHHGAAAADSKDDAVMTAIQQVEEMLSVEDMSNEAQAEKRRSISLSPAQQPEKPQSSPQQEAAVVPAPAIVPTTEQQNESTTTTTTTTAAAAANNDASISASPDEPPAPATPPLQAQVAERAEEQKKETSSSPQPAATASTTLAAVVPSLEDKDRSNPEEISKETDLRFKPVPNPAFKGSDGNDANITRVDSGSDLNVKVDDQNRATPPKETTKLNNFAPGAVAAAATVAHGDNAANATAAADVPTTTTKTTTISPPAITTTATTPTTVPATITGKKNDTEEDGSEKDYPLPPPKAEKWVISSIRRPQQLPVRAQNARMSMFSTPTPPIGIPAADPEPAASVSTGNKFHRPNAPFKIEIPNKSQSTSSQQQPAATRANAGVNNSYQAPQAAAQQVIAAGRAHAHQTSSWQSPVNSSLSRRYSSIDRYHISDRPIPTDPVAVASANAIYEDDISREDTTAEQKASDVAHSNSVGKKNNLSSFMKGVLKHDNNNGSSHSSSNNNNGLRPASEKSNYNKSHLQPTSSVSNDGSKKEKRFSMNIFKKEKKQHKQPEDPIYEDVIVSAAAAAAPALDDSNYASAPIRPLSTSMTPVSRPSSAMGGSMSGGAGGGRPMSMAYPPPSQQQPPPQPLPQQQQQQQLLDDGTVVLEYVHAIWSYEAKISTEMNFMAGDVFAVIHKQMDNWWLVELMDPQRRQRGLVPGNYMESHQ